jgi:small subunit ribosomal protein S19
MTRSIWKGLFLNSSLLRKSFIKPKLQVWCRNSIIPYFLIGKTVFVYNGKKFIKITVSRESVGFKFGEFSKTRLFNKRKKKVTKKKK